MMIYEFWVTTYISNQKLKSMSMFDVQAISKIACIISFYEWYRKNEGESKNPKTFALAVLLVAILFLNLKDIV